MKGGSHLANRIGSREEKAIGKNNAVESIGAGLSGYAAALIEFMRKMPRGLIPR